MKVTKTSGVALAAAAAALLIGGNIVPSASAQTEEKVKCYGVNACKGHGSCATANNACKGKNACKGQGFLELTKDKCTEKGGKAG